MNLLKRRKRPAHAITKARRGTAAESCLARILDGWVPAYTQGEWVREAPNAHAPLRWRSEPMTPDERAVLRDHR